jgi:hypothetical protein
MLCCRYKWNDDRADTIPVTKIVTPTQVTPTPTPVYTKEDSSNPYITFPVFKDNINATIDIFTEVVNKIETKNYEMGKIAKSEKQCGNCDMRYHCNPKQFCS